MAVRRPSEFGPAIFAKAKVYFGAFRLDSEQYRPEDGRAGRQDRPTPGTPPFQPHRKRVGAAAIKTYYERPA
jgi:hypothetical protein